MNAISPSLLSRARVGGHRNNKERETAFIAFTVFSVLTEIKNLTKEHRKTDD
jgi:hypothetical protein